jgi:hypothetical protein
MTIAEVRAYYGQEAAAFIEKEIREGRVHGPVAGFRLRNPKYTRSFLTPQDVIGYWDRNGDWITTLPDEVRFSDAVQVEIGEGR